MLIPQLADDLEECVRASGLATAAADSHRLQVHELRVEVAGRLRALGVGFGDIGELLAIHVHRVRLLLR